MQRLVDGGDDSVAPFDEPHAPFTATGLSGAEQRAVVPPFVPGHDHVQGPEPATVEAVPVPQKLVVGLLLAATPLALPHAPLTGDGGVSWAEQLAFVPLLEPAHDHVHGPVPLTVDAVPVLQRLVAGFEATMVPFAAPQTPFTGDGGGD
jgi:hypothetical protein